MSDKTWAEYFRELAQTKLVNGWLSSTDEKLDLLINTAGREFDDLATHVEELDNKVTALTDAPAANPVAEARKMLREALQKDESLHFDYLAKVGMLINDELQTRGYRPKLRSHDRADISQKLLKLLFWD